MNSKIDYKEKCKILDIYIKEASYDFDRELQYQIERNPSKMDALDMVFSITIGVIASLLQSNKEIEAFLDKVHKDSNQENPISFLGKVFKHKGDWIDQVPVLNDDGTVRKKFVNRLAEEVEEGVWKGEGHAAPHRIFWGHDIFSFGQDNPFLLEMRQYGFAKGIIQSFRHLLADTCSKQGLPIPTSSWWDKGIDENGRMHNGLLDFCQKYSEEVFGKKQPGFSNDVFSSVFSIHMQDVLSSGFSEAGIKGYCKTRNITDGERINQLKIVGFGCNFYGGVLYGLATKKIPDINWLCLLKLFKSEIGLITSSHKNITELQRVTDDLIHCDYILEQREKEINKNALGLLSKALEKTKVDNDVKNIIDIFGRENK